MFYLYPLACIQLNKILTYMNFNMENVGDYRNHVALVSTPSIFDTIFKVCLG